MRTEVLLQHLSVLYLYNFKLSVLVVLVYNVVRVARSRTFRAPDSDLPAPIPPLNAMFGVLMSEMNSH